MTSTEYMLVTAIASFVAAAVSALAAVELWKMAKEERRLKGLQPKCDLIKRFLRHRYGVASVQYFAEVVSEIPVEFSDAPEVLRIRADIRERTHGIVPTRETNQAAAGVFAGTIDLLLGDLLVAMCRNAGLKYTDSDTLEPFGDTELYMAASRSGAATRLDIVE